jgi:hypothetical protein
VILKSTVLSVLLSLFIPEKSQSFPMFFNLRQEKPLGGNVRRLPAQWDAKERMIFGIEVNGYSFVKDHLPILSIFQDINPTLPFDFLVKPLNFGKPEEEFFNSAYYVRKIAREEIQKRHFAGLVYPIIYDANFSGVFPRNHFPFSVRVETDPPSIQFVYIHRQEKLFRSWCRQSHHPSCLNAVQFPYEIDSGFLLTNGKGLCLTSPKVFQDHPNSPQFEIALEFKKYFGCNDLLVTAVIQDGVTNDTDMFFKFLPGNRILIAKVGERDPNTRPLEDTVKYFQKLVREKQISLKISRGLLLWQRFSIESLDPPNGKFPQIFYSDYINSYTLDEKNVLVPQFRIPGNIYNSEWLSKIVWPSSEKPSLISGKNNYLRKQLDQVGIEMYSRLGFHVIPVPMGQYLGYFFNGGALNCFTSEVFSPTQ